MRLRDIWIRTRLSLEELKDVASRVLRSNGQLAPRAVLTRLEDRVLFDAAPAPIAMVADVDPSQQDPARDSAAVEASIRPVAKRSE